MIELRLSACSQGGLVLDCHDGKQFVLSELRRANQNLAIVNEPSVRAEPVVVLLDTDSQFRTMPVFCQQPLKGECTA